MPPKKQAAKTPSRRSTRIASREASKEPSVEPTCPAPPPPPAPAPAPAKKETAPLSIDAIICNIQAKIGKKRGAKEAQKFINSLTREQCEAALISLARQARNLETETEDLTEENRDLRWEVDSAKERAKPSIRRDAFIKKIESYAQEEQSSSSEPAREEKQPVTPSAAITNPSAPATGPVNAVQSPPQRPGQKSPAAAARAARPQATSAEIEPAPLAAPSPWRNIIAGLTGYIPGLRKRKAADEAATPDSTPKRAKVTEPEITPVSRPSPRSGLMRSAKNPEVPSSLSTISEHTEPLSMMEGTTPTAPDITPSKPRRTTSTQATSAPPMRTSVTPMRRTATQNRAAVRSNQVGTTPTRPYAWEKNAAKPKPKEPNADARLAKLQQLQELEAKAKQAQQQADEYKAEMARMKQDADIREIEAHSVHRRKRVKVDHLKVIPHNRPGDSSSTFRVPEIDSDDEMSVDEDVEEDSNVFEELEKRYEQAQEQTPVQTIVQTQTMPTTAQAPRTVAQQPMFMFPDVAKKPDNYHVSEEFKTAAGDVFLHGFEQYVSA